MNKIIGWAMVAVAAAWKVARIWQAKRGPKLHAVPKEEGPHGSA